ncbi:valacyclovir hydrolase [Catalinimonas alkaloidigena]|uniref:alpha/beta fold hydrolase n=1 Tax=Catalinimonas alkaloidigena TaxID=1075417 RepID=UPI00240550D6|nr:alpha/beta hydrolase [Catalinimonas alkaloidigena]MDF9796098.1 valacyclovir hydrolase [Catalinimonas alkaloidigena]
MFDHKSGAYLQTEDAKLYYETQGNPDNPPLLFLHGGLRHMVTLNPLAQSLAKDFYLIGLDSRGQGKSGLGDNPLTYQMMEEDTLALLSHLNINKVTIIGHSDGGIIAYRMAARHRERVAHLITIGSRVTAEQGKPNWEEFMCLEPKLMEKNMPELVKDYHRLSPDPRLDQLCVMFRDLWMDGSDCGHPGEAVRSIVAPSLLLRGSEDGFLSAVALQDNQMMISNSVMTEIPDAKHDVALENPEHTNSVIRNFLSTQ